MSNLAPRYNSSPRDTQGLDYHETILGHLVLEQRLSFDDALYYLDSMAQSEVKDWKKAAETTQLGLWASAAAGGFAFVTGGFGVVGIATGAAIGGIGCGFSWLIQDKAEKVLPFRECEANLVRHHPWVRDEMKRLLDSGVPASMIISRYDLVLKSFFAAGGVTTDPNAIRKALQPVAPEPLPIQSEKPKSILVQRRLEREALAQQGLAALRDIPIDDSPIIETTANTQSQDIPESFGSNPKAETIAATVVQATGQDQDAPRIEQNRFIDVLMDNPYQSRAIIAGQRTGKTYGAAVATWCLSQDGTAIYYINLFDHGQGNREAFSHARCVIGDLDELNRDDGADLVADAIQLIHEFRKSSDAILVVDEWAVLGHENQNTPGIDSLWKALGAETSRSCSNGIGNGRAIWGIAPSFKADPLKKEAKTLKECAPMILSITPGSSIPWTNPRSGKVTQVKAQPQIIGDVLKNWPGCCASLPSDEQSRQWRREGVERVYWYQGQWHPMGSCPALPNPKAKPAEPVSKATDFPVEAIGRAVGATSRKTPVDGLSSEVLSRADLGGDFEADFEVKGDKPKPIKKPSAEAEVLRYLQSVGVPKRVTEIRNGAKRPVKGMPSDRLRDLLGKMVESGTVKTDGTRFYF